MPPLRRRDIRPQLSNPAIARRLARGSMINVPPIDAKYSAYALTNDELEIALAEKELELSLLLSSTENDCVKDPYRRSLSPQRMQPSPHFQVPEIVDSFDSFTAMRSQFLQYLANNEQLNIIPESKLYHSIYFPYGYCLKYIELMIGQTSRCSLKASVSHRHTFLFNIFRWLIDIGNFGSESIVTHSLSLLNNLITSMVYLCSGRLWSTHIQFLGLTFSISVPYIFDLVATIRQL